MIYARTIAVTRPGPQDGVGAQPYQGLQISNEVAVASGIPASIQLSRRSGQPDPGLPGDAVSATGWSIFIPRAYSTLGLFTERDIVTDDLGKRYQIVAAYWNILGYNLSCTLLEA